MKVAIHQPHYLPWLGYLEKWRRADLLIVLDTVQFERGGWQNRCKYLTAQGERWLTVPVHHQAGQLIKDVKIAGDHWRKDHLRTLEWLLPEVPEALRGVYELPWTFLSDLAVRTMRVMEPTLPMALASQGLDGPLAEDSTDRLVRLCVQVGATTYLHGAGAANYLRPEAFEEAGIALEAVTGDWPPYTALQVQAVAA